MVAAGGGGGGGSSFPPAPTGARPVSGSSTSGPAAGGGAAAARRLSGTGNGSAGARDKNWQEYSGAGGDAAPGVGKADGLGGAGVAPDAARPGSSSGGDDAGSGLAERLLSQQATGSSGRPAVGGGASTAVVAPDRWVPGIGNPACQRCNCTHLSALPFQSPLLNQHPYVGANTASFPDTQ